MKSRTLPLLAVITECAVLSPIRQAMPAAGPVFSDSGPDAVGYGAAQDRSDETRRRTLAAALHGRRLQPLRLALAIGCGGEGARAIAFASISR
jgi:hypothetical protein